MKEILNTEISVKRTRLYCLTYNLELKINIH